VRSTSQRKKGFAASEQMRRRRPIVLPLRADQTALLVMDCQNAIVHPDGAIARSMGFAGMIEASATLDRVADLMEHARRASVRILHVRIDPTRRRADRTARRGHFFAAMTERRPSPLAPGSWGAEFHERCRPGPGETVIGKFPVSAFSCSDLDDELSRAGTTDLVLAGVATHMVVESTTRQASDRGYSVVVAHDACMAGSQAQHEASLAVQSTFADVLGTEEIVELWGHGREA
jgi:nicotinamidase-related amidase